VSEHEYRAAPGAVKHLPRFGALPGLPSHVLASPAAQHRPGSPDDFLQNASDGRGIERDIAKYPVHRVVWPGDEAVQGHRDVSKNLTHSCLRR
jgi:hypothetical protein